MKCHNIDIIDNCIYVTLHSADTMIIVVLEIMVTFSD